MTSPYQQPERWGDYGQYGQSWAAEQPRHQPPEPPGRRTGRTVAIVVAALALVAGVGIGTVLLTGDDSVVTTPTTTVAPPGETLDARPGDCVKVNIASTTHADVRTVDCASAEATYRVAIRAETAGAACPSEQYVSYEEEGRLRLCLQLNVRDGECIEVRVLDDRRLDCAAPAATHRVVGVLDGVADQTRCDTEATDVIVYPEPPRTICLAAPAK
jgi:hypothetical protein